METRNLRFVRWWHAPVILGKDSDFRIRKGILQPVHQKIGEGLNTSRCTGKIWHPNVDPHENKVKSRSEKVEKVAQIDRFLISTLAFLICAAVRLS